jgi:hypothetical protein
VLNAPSYEEAARISASFLARRAARTAYSASSIASAAKSTAKSASVPAHSASPFGHVSLDRGLRGVDSLSHSLGVLVPVALDLLPLSLCLVRGFLPPRPQFSGAGGRTLARFVGLGLDRRLVLRGRRLDALVGLLDLRRELCEAIR